MRHTTMVFPLIILLAAAQGCELQVAAPTSAINATNAAPTSIDVNVSAGSLIVGQQSQLTASVKDEDGHAISTATVAWSSAHKNIADVSSSGLVTAISPGTVVITATYGDLSAHVPLSVSAPLTGEPVASIIPELPRDTVDVSMPAVTGRSISVPPGADLQSALDGAQPGDELVLAAGATYVGTLVLRAKSGSGWIIIRSSGSLPNPGTRVEPSDSAQMPRLVASAPTNPVIRTEAGASHYRLIGLEITAQTGATLAYSLVSLGDASSAQNSVAAEPHHLVFDRVYIHGTPTLDFQRCVALNSAWTAIVDSWLSECHGKGKDSQAIAGWNGTGPYKIVNDHVEGAGENIMFGGADPVIPNGLPADIEIRRNHIIKPLDWKGVWEAKNLLEIKIGQRVLIEGNVLENSWADAQTGYAMNLKSTDQNGGAPWSQTSDITVRNNLVTNVANGVSIAAHPETYPVVPASRMLFEQNVFDRIGTLDFTGGRLFQVTGVDSLTLSHNTAVSSHSFLILVNSTDLIQALSVTDNIFAGSTYGLSGDGDGYGTAALNARAVGWKFQGNILTGLNASQYPTDNQFLQTTADVGFIDYINGNMALSSWQPSSAGADVATVQNSAAAVVP